MAWNDEVVKYAENAVAIKACQEDIKSAIESVGINMTGVAFSSYANKIKEVAAVSGSGHIALVTSSPLYPSRVEEYSTGTLTIGVTSAINPIKIICNVGQGNADSHDWTWGFKVEGRRKGTDTWDTLCSKNQTVSSGSIGWITDTFTVSSDYYYDQFRITAADRGRISAGSYIAVTGLVSFESNEEVEWLSKTGELAVLTSSFTTANGVAGSDIYRFDKPIRNFSGYMKVKGSGGYADYRQFGTDVYCFLDSSCSEDNMVSRGSQYTMSTGERTVEFSLGNDIEIYGIKYTVWSANANGATPLPVNTCTEAKVTTWEYLVTG